MNKNQMKVEGNIVYWWNGKKWLVKETFATEAEALAFLET